MESVSNNKSTTSKQTKAAPAAKVTAAPKETVFVPQLGVIQARDQADVEAQVKRAKK